jgi:hypothetical protein
MAEFEDFDHPFDLPDDADRVAHRKLDQLLKGQQLIMTALTDLANQESADSQELIGDVQTLLANQATAVTAAVSTALAQSAASDATVTSVLSAADAAVKAEDAKVKSALGVSSSLSGISSSVSGVSTSTASVSTSLAPTSLTISPDTYTPQAGVAHTQFLTISGGVPPYTASGLAAGVTFDGSNLVAGNTTVATPATQAVISDASTPPVQGDVSVTITP